ncbi:LysR substrate-binding domain-containing protein [Bacillus sp. JJ1521]|uniref:LysR substrate-binding domain-containing protein n=1 Tax=Bacillus sp. JJ1521 TaxID=3122957 RepID=UPI003F68A3FF
MILETNSIHLAYNLVQEDKGFTFLPGVAVKSLHQLKPGVFYQMQDYIMERNFYACFRTGSYLSPSIKYLIQSIAQLL